MEFAEVLKIVERDRSPKAALVGRVKSWLEKLSKERFDADRYRLLFELLGEVWAAVLLDDPELQLDGEDEYNEMPDGLLGDMLGATGVSERQFWLVLAWDSFEALVHWSEGRDTDIAGYFNDLLKNLGELSELDAGLDGQDAARVPLEPKEPDTDWHGEKVTVELYLDPSPTPGPLSVLKFAPDGTPYAEPPKAILTYPLVAGPRDANGHRIRQIAGEPGTPICILCGEVRSALSSPCVRKTDEPMLASAVLSV